MDTPADPQELENPTSSRQRLGVRWPASERIAGGRDISAVQLLRESLGFPDDACRESYNGGTEKPPALASCPPSTSPSVATSQPAQDTQDLGSSGPIHDGQRSDDRGRLAIIAVLALTLVLACTILSFFLPEAKLLGALSGWCDTSECRRHATLLTHGLNRSIDPCQDFHDYVCSTWEPDPRFASVLRIALDDLSIRWLNDLEELLHESVFHMPVAEKPLDMYRACVNNSGASVEDWNLFRRFLSDRGLSWPEPPPSDVSASSVIVNLALRWQMSLWLRIRVLKHPFVPGGRRFLLLPGRKSEARLFVAMHEYVMATDQYPRYWRLIYSFVKGQQPHRDVSDLIKSSAEAQGNSVAMLFRFIFTGYVTPSIFRLSNISEQTWNETGGHWVKSLSENLFPLEPLSPLDDVLIANTDLLDVLRTFIPGSGDEKVLADISWQVVQMYSLMLDRTLLEDILRDKQQASSVITLLCARELDAVYNPILAALYVRSRLTSMGRKHVSALFQTMTQGAVDAVNQLSWLDLESRQFFAQRLESTVVRLWPADLFDDAQKVETLYIHCPRSERSFMRLWLAVRECLGDLLMGEHRGYLSAMAPNFTPYPFTYDPFEPSAELVMAVLASPVYSTRGTPGMLFGGLGSLFATLLLHAFDKPKQPVHSNGSIKESGSWLSVASTEALIEKQKCIGSSLLSTVAGLEIAHSLFLQRLENSFHRNLSSELTDEKVFFMTFCRLLCSKNSLWGHINCNSIVKHVGGFSAAFHCSSSSPLTPREQCQPFLTRGKSPFATIKHVR
ncbi:neprilysin-1-like [Dermacentor variabilis]|uniref:neprilysin-1-like n=1 Tax=Dermacentor variabilis TaxID=34621 RepID=UPI003F5B4DC1